MTLTPVCLLVLAPLAFGETIAVTYSGHIDASQVPDIPVGAVFTGSVSYNSAGTILSSGANYVNYSVGGSGFSIVLNVGGFTFSGSNYLNMLVSRGPNNSKLIPNADIVDINADALSTLSTSYNGRVFSGLLTEFAGPVAFLQSNAIPDPFNITELFLGSTAPLSRVDLFLNPPGTTSSGASVSGYVDSVTLYTTIDYPGSPTGPRGINSTDTVVGVYGAGDSQQPSFLYVGHAFRTFTYPSSWSYVQPADINDNGQIVGTYYANGAVHGFFKNGQTFTTIDFTNAINTYAQATNNLGHVAGYLNDVRGTHGFLDSFSFDYPGSLETAAFGLNDPGQVVGTFADARGHHGYLKDLQGFTAFDYPGATGTFAQAIDNAGQIAGYYTNAAGIHGFLKTGDTFSSLDYPGASQTNVWGINNNGEMAGSYYVGNFPTYQTHGFIASHVSGSISAPPPTGPTVSLWANTSIPLGQSTPLPVSLTAPAPPGGITVSLTSSSAGVSVTPSVFVPAGRKSPNSQPLVAGIDIGEAWVTAAAPGFLPTTQHVIVTAAVAFQRCCVTIRKGTTQNVILNLSAPAPPGGLTIQLVSETPGVATVPTTAIFPANATSINVPITGAAAGKAVIQASGAQELIGGSIKVTVQ